MATREKVLEYLELHKGERVSGEKLAEALNLSRNAVWKAINALRDDGYLLDASPKKGYCLLNENKILSAQSISKHLKSQDFYRINVYDCVTSTNTLLRQAAERGETEGLVIAANEQSAGKGRLGRGFYSPSGGGIYMSVLLRPRLPAAEALFITTAAAVAVASAIEEQTGEKALIKWVNDIYCREKKVCGILTEASIDFESGGISYAVLGIGINLSDPETGFPGELSDIAGSVLGGSPCPPEAKPRLIAAILDRFFEYYRSLPEKSFMEEYRSRSYVIGREIVIISAGGAENALAVDIDDEGALVVKTESGETRRLSSGEISIRVKKHAENE